MGRENEPTDLSHFTFIKLNKSSLHHRRIIKWHVMQIPHAQLVTPGVLHNEAQLYATELSRTVDMCAYMHKSGRYSVEPMAARFLAMVVAWLQTYSALGRKIKHSIPIPLSAHPYRLGLSFMHPMILRLICGAFFCTFFFLLLLILHLTECFLIFFMHRYMFRHLKG